MSDYTNILTDTIPAWYRMGFDDQSMQIIIHIHPSEMERLEETLPQSPSIKEFEKKLTTAFMSSGDYWGLDGGAQKSLVQFKDWPCLAFPIPDGKNRKDLQILATNLHILFQELVTTSSNTDSDFSQLYCINVFSCSEGEMGRAFFSANISPTFFNWLHGYHEACPPGQILVFEEAIDNMKKVFQHLSSDDFEWEQDEFRAYLNKNVSLQFSCPGFCSCLGPIGDHGGEKDTSGYSLVPHNIDSFAQQITLFVGLVKVGEYASDEIMERQ